MQMPKIHGRALARAATVFAFTALSTGAWAGGIFNVDYAPSGSSIVDLKRAEDRFIDKRKEAAAAPRDSDAIAEYVQSGLTLSDVACHAWLLSLGRSERDTNLFKDVFNIVGNLIIGIAGINGASPSSLARGSLGLSAVNASVDSFRTEVLLGTISDIETKVKDGRKVSAAFFVEHPAQHYDEAQRKLLEYHDTCSPTAIKMLLKTSLAQVKYVAPDVTFKNPVDTATADVLAAQLFGKLNTSADGRYDVDTLYALYVTLIAAPNDTTTPFVQTLKQNRYVADVTAAFSKLDDAAKAGFVQLLQRIAVLRGFSARYDAQAKAAAADTATAVDATRKQEDQAAAADVARDAQVRQDAAKKAEAASQGGQTEAAVQAPLLSAPSRQLSLLIAPLVAGPDTTSSAQQLQGLATRAAELARQSGAPEDSAVAAKLAALARQRQLSEDARRAKERQLALANGAAAVEGKSVPSIAAVLVPVNR